MFHIFSRYLVWTVLIVGVLIVATYFLIGMFVTPQQLNTAVKDLLRLRGSGDYGAVVSRYDEIIADPTMTPDDRAIAIVGLAGTKFHLTGNMDDRIQDVRNLKVAVLDPRIMPLARSVSIYTLAAQYEDSGRDPRVFAEIFKDPPFTTYLVKGSSEESIRKLYEWSYSILPSPFAAVHIAAWYSKQYVYQNATLTADQKADYQDKAKYYLAKADIEAAKLLGQNQEYSNSSPYLVYKYFRAQTIGYLAMQGLEPFTQQYKGEWENLIEYMKASGLAIGTENVFFARYTYAAELRFAEDRSLRDEEAAKKQLALLSQELNALERPETHGFVQMVMNLKLHNEGGVTWSTMQALTRVSPEFKAAIDKIIALIPADAVPTQDSTYDY